MVKNINRKGSRIIKSPDPALAQACSLVAPRVIPRQTSARDACVATLAVPRAIDLSPAPSVTLFSKDLLCDVLWSLFCDRPLGQNYFCQWLFLHLDLYYQVSFMWNCKFYVFSYIIISTHVGQYQNCVKFYSSLLFHSIILLWDHTHF